MIERKDYDALFAKVGEKIRSAEAKLERQLKDGTASSECNEEMHSCDGTQTQCCCHFPGMREVSPRWTAYCNLRRRIGELKCDEAAIMEECRAEKLLSEYYEEHPNVHQYRIDCPICMECVPLDGHFVMTPCCGIYLCSDCSSATLNRDPCDCPFCRATLRGPDASRNEMLEENIAKGKSWALWQKGNAFFLDGHYEKALKCFHRAYDGGFERSAQMISISYHCLLEEDTCAHDEHKRKALAWARKSAEMGFAIASDGQIIAYLGDDDDEALRWLTISAHIGDANAQSELSQWFSHGKRGVEKSLECALYWSKRASQGKSDDGIFYLGHVVWDLATEWYGGCSGYTGHEARCETFHLFRRAEGLGHSNAMEYIEKLKSGQEKFCSNALCVKEKNDCPGECFPITCMRCSFERYCSLQCLASDWKARHKDDCRPWKNS